MHLFRPPTWPGRRLCWREGWTPGSRMWFHTSCDNSCKVRNSKDGAINKTAGCMGTISENWPRDGAGCQLKTQSLRHNLLHHGAVANIIIILFKMSEKWQCGILNSLFITKRNCPAGRFFFQSDWAGWGWGSCGSSAELGSSGSMFSLLTTGSHKNHRFSHLSKCNKSSSNQTQPDWWGSK